MLDALIKEGLYVPENVLFLLAIHFQELHPGMLDYIGEFKQANLLSRLYCETKDGRIQLKPGVLNSAQYSDFLVKLNQDYFIGPNGHINNPAAYSLSPYTTEAIKAFDILILRRPDLSIDTIAKQMAEHYEKSKYPKSFARYLAEDAPMLINE